MVELEKLKFRIETVDAAIAACKTAVTCERKMATEKHLNGHLTTALQELEKVKKHVEDLIHRAEAQGN